MESRVISLPLQQFPDPDLRRCGTGPAARQKHSPIATMPAGRGVKREANGLATQMGWRVNNAQLFHGKTETPWPVQAIQIGPWPWSAIAGEPFSSIATARVAKPRRSRSL
ncbi:MAG: hypothetical protein QM757_41515 [Paludibaculum sp.]